MTAVDVVEGSARNVDDCPRGIPTAAVVAAVDGAADTAARDVYFAVRDLTRRRSVRDMSAVDRAIDRTARDGDFALVCCACCICSRKGCTVDGADVAIRDLSGVLCGIAVLGAYFGTVGVGDVAARDDDGVLFRVARREWVAVCVELVVLHKAAVRRRTDGAACHGELVVLDLVADGGASCPCCVVGAIARAVGCARTVLVLVPCRTHFGGVDQGAERVDAELEVPAVDALNASVCTVGIDAVLREVDAVQVPHEGQVIRLVGADRAVEVRRIDGELAPVEVVRCRTCIEGQHGVRGVQRTAVDVELQVLEVLDVARCRVGVDVQRVARIRTLVAAVDGARDIGDAAVGTVAKAYGVAGRCARAVRKAAVDITADRAAAEENVTARNRARSNGVSTIDVACDGAAGQGDFALRNVSGRACCRKCCAIEAATDTAARKVRLVFSRAARFGFDLCAIGVCRLCSGVQEEFVLFGIARGLVVAVGIPLGVFNHAAACNKGGVAAREGQLVVQHLVADDGTSAPCLGCRTARMVRCVVLEAVALEVDVLRCGTVAVGRDVRLVIVRMDAPARTPRTVVAEVDVAAVVHECQDAVARGTGIQAVEVVDVEFVPVKVRGIAVIERQEGIPHRDMTARRLKVDLVEVCNVARRDAVVDVEGVVRRDSLAAAVNGTRDGSTRSDGIRRAAEVDGVACGGSRPCRPSTVDVLHRAARDGNGVARGTAGCRRMGKIPAVDVAVVACAGDTAARDIHVVARCVSALHGGKAAVDVAYGAHFEVNGVDGAVVLCRSGRARARRPAAVGITMVRAVDGEDVLGSGVADDGASRPDILRGVTGRRCGIGILELIAAKEDLLCHRRVGVGVDSVLMRARGGDFLRTVVMTDVDARHVLHEDGCSARRISCMLEFVPVKIGRSAADEIQHGIRLVECAVEVELHHAEVRDVARLCIGIDVQDVIGIRRLIAAVDGARDGGDTVCGAAAEVYDVACGGTRCGVSAVDAAVDRAAIQVDGMPRRRARSGDFATVDIAADSSGSDLDSALGRVSGARPREFCAVDSPRDRARNIDVVLIGTAVLCRDFCAVGIGKCAARDIERVLCRRTRRLIRAVAVVLFVLDQSAVGVRCIPCEGQLVVCDGLSARCAPCPCVGMSCRLAVRRRVIAKLIAVDVDILCARRMVRRVDGVFFISDDLFLGSIRRIVAECDAGAVVHRRKEVLVVRARRKGGAAGVHFDPCPVKACSRTAADGKERVRCRLADNGGAVEVELGLAEVLNAACRDVLRVDVQRVVRHDIGCRAARCAAVDKGITQSGRIKCAVTLAEVDGVARRLARAVRIAAVDFGTAAECSVFNVDDVARDIARRDVVRRREHRIRRDVPAVELAARIQRTALDVDRVLRCIGILCGIYQRWIRFTCWINEQVNPLGITRIAICDRTTREQVQCVLLRAAILCVCIACTRIREVERCTTVILQIESVVVRRIPIDRNTRMNIRRARRRGFRCILKTVAIEGENRNTNSPRSGGICSLAKFVIADRTDQIRTVVAKRECRSRIERCHRIIHTICF